MPEPSTRCSAPGRDPLRLVVIGAGPKALFALEELQARLAAGAGRALEVVVVDPGEHPGTGAAYRPDQPAPLRLNVDCRVIDAPASSTAASFPAWCAEHAPQLAEELFPPRAVVGQYLAERWSRLWSALGEHADLTRVRTRATAVQPVGETWSVQLKGGEVITGADEVLVATGHARAHEGALARSWQGAVPLRPAVLPPEEMLDPVHVPPGSRVALRGAALTFLDAALMLTEGRGGRFVEQPDGALRHERGAAEPAVLLPTARRGLLLDAKPQPNSPAAHVPERLLTVGQERLRRLDPADPRVVEQVLAVVVDTALTLLEDRGAPASRVDIEHTLATGAEPDLPIGPGQALTALERSVQVACGERAPGPAWALGRAWARLYPALTGLLRGLPAPEETWQRFRDAAQVLERFAFGPPLATALKLLAMHASGAVDLGPLEAGTTVEQLATSGEADVVVDAVLPPPGVQGLDEPLLRQLLTDGLITVRPGRRGAMIAPDASALRADGSTVTGLALLGRPTEDHVIGHDTLNRHLHQEPERWAERLTGRLRTTDPLRAHCQGMPPLDARLEPWMRELLGDPEACRDLVERFGSPLNVHDFSALPRHAAELTEAADDAGVELAVFVARKANKTLGMVAAAQEAGLGLDVGSLRELSQALEHGMPAQRIVVTAAIKPRPLLELALECGAMLVLDNLDEAAAVLDVLATAGRTDRPGAAPPALALRLAPTPVGPVPPTRFGESAATWRAWVASPAAREAGARIAGVHFHLHGYDAAARALAIGEACTLIDALREAGHEPTFVDMGGGIPMSYLDDQQQWEASERAVRTAQGPDPADWITWEGAPLTQHYPYHQAPVRGDWLRGLLASPASVDEADGAARADGAAGSVPTAAEALRSRGLRLACEPGRSLLDGCGMTLTRVIQRTSTSHGAALVGVEMNRTQCRSTSDDFLVDPLLVRIGTQSGEPMDAFVVGAYCIEAELILRRRLHFPSGVAVGDILALPNTAGYLMHILESASHQLPLASNVVRREGGFVRDGIDAIAPQRPWEEEPQIRPPTPAPRATGRADPRSPATAPARRPIPPR
ncbi:FAD/NAD(P)-binding protein [Brachybacterium sp. UMB0905]|uniref:FAD/NAD(P)-binding protein n=1 Tax=Brachybacterium sp. UMB0905 TaxID=2069310 RepID=UPI0013042749|nr:FAD/NAD(P)-binding protein [Brachybacterium sp. UMB0905]